MLPCRYSEWSFYRRDLFLNLTCYDLLRKVLNADYDYSHMHVRNKQIIIQQVIKFLFRNGLSFFNNIYLTFADSESEYPDISYTGSLLLPLFLKRMKVAANTVGASPRAAASRTRIRTS